LKPEDAVEIMSEFLLVRMDPPATMHGDIFIPESRNSYPVSGIIVKRAAHPEHPYFPGDHIVFAPHAGELMLLHGEKFKLINANEVQAVLVDVEGIPL
jgi:co-chaperonin GroES (HSP10)